MVSACRKQAAPQQVFYLGNIGMGLLFCWTGSPAIVGLTKVLSIFARTTSASTHKRWITMTHRLCVNHEKLTKATFSAAGVVLEDAYALSADFGGADRARKNEFNFYGIRS